MQISKLTPFRTTVVLVGTAVASVFARALNLEVLHVYISVSMVSSARIPQTEPGILKHAVGRLQGQL